MADTTPAPAANAPPADPNMICGTNLCYKDAEAAMQKSLGTDATWKEWSAVEIGAGKGFLSCMAKVAITWSSDDAKLPKSVVIKIPTAKNFEGMLNCGVPAMESMARTLIARLPKLHDGEVCIFERYSNRDNFPVTLPRSFGQRGIGSAGEAGYIIEEDLSATTGQTTMMQSLSKGQLKAIVSELAKLQAWSLKTKWQEPRLHNTFKDVIDEDQFTAEMSKFHDWLEQQEDITGRMTPEAIAKIKTLKPDNKLLTKILEMHHADGIPDVLVHGDMWMNNVLIAKDSEGNLLDKIAAVIDWQVVHPGSPCEDIGRLMTSSVTPDVRAECSEEVLKHFYDTLAAECGGEAPFKYDAFIRLYERTFVLSVMFFLPMFPQMMDMMKAGTLPMKFAGMTVEEFVAKFRKDLAGMMSETAELMTKHADVLA